MHGHRFFALLAATAAPWLAAPWAVAAQACATDTVPYAVLVEEMRRHGPFDPLATMNRGRFTSGLLIRLGHGAREQGADRPWVIHPDDWFRAFLETTGVEAHEAPISARMGHRNRQWVMIDPRPGRVVDSVAVGPTPKLAMNVRAWWDEADNPAERFSFEDTLAEPRLRVTSRREVRYRLLEFEDMILLDEMGGLSGRPTTGVLGALFSLIGEAALEESRIAVSSDGVQVARTRSSRLFSVSVTSTIDPDGTGRRGVPEGRPDLELIEERLQRDLDIEYLPYPSGPEGNCTLASDGRGGHLPVPLSDAAGPRRHR